MRESCGQECELNERAYIKEKDFKLEGVESSKIFYHEDVVYGEEDVIVRSFED